jgi:hypothetical protein
MFSLFGLAHSQSNEFATGNMHFGAKDMDANGDHMITLEEMSAYAERTWKMMSHGKDKIAIDLADRNFATGGVSYQARAIDTDHDGSISEQEYLAYLMRKLETMIRTDAMVSVDDMAKAISRGNLYPERATGSKQP